MKRFIFTLCVLLTFLSSVVHAVPISLTLPEATLAKVASQITPLEVKGGKSLKGTIHITEITDLQLRDKRISCKLSLEGKDLQLVTKIAGTKVNLAIGNISTSLATDLDLTYNKTNEEIILTPHIDSIAKGDGKAEVAGLLLSLLDGQKFPIALKDIPAIVAKSGANNIFIEMDVVDIEVQENKITALIEPVVSQKAITKKE